MIKPGRTRQGVHARTSVDQARKSDRAKELKKHKKERANIRLAIAKSGSSNADNIEKLLDLERQLCGLEEPRFHENVLRAKQKNLLSNFDKARSIFKKSDKPEDKASMDRLNATVKDYYTKCAEIRREAEMLSLARSTVVDEIPMPMAGQFTTATALQPAAPKPQPRVRFAAPPRPRHDGRRALPPGPPVGIPPEFSDSDDDMDDSEDVEQNDLGHVYIPSEISQTINPAPVPPPLPVMMPLRGPPLPPPPVAPFLGQCLSVAPVLNRPAPAPPTVLAPEAAPISAQPVMRDLKGESTRMVPAQLLRAKEKKGPTIVRRPMAPVRHAQTGKTTDEAYDEFMSELAGLL